MRILSIRLISFFTALAVTLPLLATHNKAGEITFRQISQYTFEATLITYTDNIAGRGADRPTITLFWGDGTSSNINRESQTDAAYGIWKNVYRAQHTYRGPNRYKIQFTDPNRVNNILNIDNGQSQDVQFYIESLLIIDPAVGFNQSPILLQPPIDFACFGKPFYHYPNAYDPDGDSLNFSLVTPLKGENENVPGYTIPSASSFFGIDKHTGKVTWDAPLVQGIYNIAILIEEYRHKKRIGYVIRDMQIIVQSCTNQPPVIDALKDTCVEAGKSVELTVNVRATDPDKGDRLTMTASGGPFLQTISPAFFTPDPSVGTDSVTATFKWNIACEHIQKEPYRVVFRVVDNDSHEGGMAPLSDLKHIDIHVVGPAPENLKATAFGNAINLSWNKPACINPKGYLIYRKIDSSAWKHNYCETGVPGSTGFELIDTIVSPDILTYIDDNHGQSLSPGLIYCYRITALYLNKGRFEFTEGYHSNESCAQLKKDVPVITHVSVLTTDGINGKIYVDWSKPTEIDTLEYPGPYRYTILRNGSAVKSYTSPSFSALNDSVYIDSGLNTFGQQYSYRIEFYNTLIGKENLIGRTIAATSVYLSLKRWHYSIKLNWNVSVPWKNKFYVIYRENKGTGNWDSIGTSVTKFYTDSGLVLGQTYCYKVKSVGSYFTHGFVDPLVNWSEYTCSRPKDTVKPCPPLIDAKGDCETRSSTITWTIPDTACNKDVVKYKIYYSPLRTNNYILAGSVNKPDSMLFTDIREELHASIAGCYKVTAVDSFENESVKSSESCVENCPVYELPNVITPNGDEMNDLFQPMTGYRFVSKIDLHIFNRWGEEVFTTTDPVINWNGDDLRSGNPLPGGVYYYICTVNEIYLDGDRQRSLKGTVHIIR